MKCEDFFLHYGHAIVAFSVCSVIVTFPDRSALSALIGSGLMALNYYFSHRLLHLAPGYWNFHLNMHHEKLGFPRWLELLIEGILEFFYFMFFPLVIQATSKDWIIPFSVIVLLSMTYTSYHIYNYSILGSKDHSRHHENPEKNFSPNFLDHLFDTNFNDEHEDLNPGIVNLVACTLVTLYLKRVFGWTDLTRG